MKGKASLVSIIFLLLVSVVIRFGEISMNPGKPLCITRWDAFGYYAYDPAIFIYQDYKQLNWLDTIDKKYDMTGGDGWQAHKEANGNYVFKYLGGIAVMQLPFFAIGHIVALNSSYPADGFSAPYQYALTFGALLYCFLALLLLRSILLRYFTDKIVAVTLLFLMLASNIYQYASIDNGLSHIYIFFLYAAVLYVTVLWHERPTVIRAFLIGWITGLATISRPTEAIMLFIPLLWGLQDKAAASAKWALVKQYRPHVIVAIIAGVIGILPQLLYWKSASGSFIYDVGSKWHFLDPFFRVLFGWEKGWFIYTPICVFFIAGMFFMKKFPFQKSVIWFCLLNIWIVTAWDDWRYGGTYSTRALSQSYPVFALAFASFVHWIWQYKARFVFITLGIYLSAVNLFQLWQYQSTVLHYNDMNRKYYSRVYLNPHPSPFDMSLLDTDEWLDDEAEYKKQSLVLRATDPQSSAISVPLIQTLLFDTTKVNWLKLEATIVGSNSLWQKRLQLQLIAGDSTKTTSIRLFNPIGEKTHQYACYVKVPAGFPAMQLKMGVMPEGDTSVQLKAINVEGLSR